MDSVLDNYDESLYDNAYYERMFKNMFNNDKELIHNFLVSFSDVVEIPEHEFTPTFTKLVREACDK